MLYVWLQRDIEVKRYILGVLWAFCMMAYAIFFICRSIPECRRRYLTRGGIFMCCVVNNGKMQVILFY